MASAAAEFPVGLDTATLASQFQRDGYLVLEKILSDDVIKALIDSAANLVDNFDADSHKTIFKTKDQAKVSNEYFLDSASKISFFFEPDAFDENGELKQAKELSINKIGHALHDLDPTFDRFCRSDLMKTTVKEIVRISHPLLVQSMYIYKQPRIGGEVAIHQDNWFIHTDPLSCCGLWFSLEDATKDNGCLYAVPGSHKDYPCQKRFTRDGDKVKFDDDEPLAHPPKDEDFIALPVPAGSMVLIHGGLLHKSYSNVSKNSRQAFTMHVVDSNSEYSAKNWLQRPDMPFAGINENPYRSE